MTIMMMTMTTTTMTVMMLTLLLLMMMAAVMMMTVTTTTTMMIIHNFYVRGTPSLSLIMLICLLTYSALRKREPLISLGSRRGELNFCVRGTSPRASG